VFRSSRALLLRVRDLGEADLGLSFFTEEAGLVAVVGKSARRSRKRFGGILQRYLLLHIHWTERPGRAGVLEQAAVAESFWPIASDWERVRHADELLDLAATLFPQPGPKPVAFRALVAGLGEIAAGRAPGAAACRARAALLAAAGWGPDLSGCRFCGMPEAGSFRFDVPAGRIACGACAPEGMPLSAGAVKTWRALQGAAPGALSRVRIGDRIVAELQDVMARYIEWHITSSSRSARGRGGPAGS